MTFRLGAASGNPRAFAQGEFVGGTMHKLAEGIAEPDVICQTIGAEFTRPLMAQV